MRRIDQLHLDYPFAGSRMLRDMLVGEGVKVGRRHVGTLMRRMGIEALRRLSHYEQEAPCASSLPVPAARLGHRARQRSLGAGHHVHPYGPRLGVPGGRTGLVQPPRAHPSVVHHDGPTSASRLCGRRRPGTDRRKSSTPTRAASPAALSSSPRWSALALAKSMDGRGCLRDNVFVERLWRSVKYEDVYLKAYDSDTAARAGMAAYFAFYDALRAIPEPRRARARHGLLQLAAAAFGAATG